MTPRKNIPEVKLPPRDNHSEGYVARGRRWSTNDLIKAVEEQKLSAFPMPLATVDLARLPWAIDSLDDIIYHMEAVAHTNLKYPVILDEYGGICNGYHRVVKAILKGDTEIMVVRLTEMPRSEARKD